MKFVNVQAEDFDVASLQSKLQALTPGAISSFTGLVRGDGGITAMTLEHYPGMTLAALHALADEAQRRWTLSGVIIVHRFGRLIPGDHIVYVSAASPHRQAALEACGFLIDRLKTEAPLWKKEDYADGHASWVEAKSSDDIAAQRWR